jgi:hypothetical protein
VLQTNAIFADKLKRGTWPMPHVTVPEPVRHIDTNQIDAKEKRRRRFAAISNIILELNKETLARLAK